MDTSASPPEDSNANTSQASNINPTDNSSFIIEDGNSWNLDEKGDNSTSPWSVGQGYQLHEQSAGHPHAPYTIGGPRARAGYEPKSLSGTGPVSDIADSTGITTSQQGPGYHDVRKGIRGRGEKAKVFSADMSPGREREDHTKSELF